MYRTFAARLQGFRIGVNYVIYIDYVTCVMTH
jgi:hypothetical protein